MITRYYQGGIDPAAPAQNKAEQWDDTARTYTAWNTSGVQTATRAFTAAENTAADADAAQVTAATNTTTLAGKVAAALTANTTYLARATPTNAQVTAQVERLTRETNALLRQVWSQLSDVSDT